VHRGDVRRTVLFDTGPEDYAFERNVTRLGVDLARVESIVLSHGHADHAGAMLLALGMIRGRNGGRDVPFYAHSRYVHDARRRQPTGRCGQMEDVPSLATSRIRCGHGGDDGSRKASSTGFSTSAVKSRAPRGSSAAFPGQMRRTAGGWEPDELLIDERWLAVNVAGRGLVLFSRLLACRHRQCVQARAGDVPGLPIHA